MAVAAGQRITASMLNPVKASLYQIATQTVTTGVWTTVSFDGEYEDSHSGHSTVTTNSTFTIPLTRTYSFKGGGAFAANASGLRGVKILKNGVIINRSTNYSGPGPTVGSTPFNGFDEPCNAGDTITMQIFQASGGNVATLANGEAACHLSISSIGS